MTKYFISLLFIINTLTAGNAWWTKIEPYPIYIGALPLKDRGHLKKIPELGVTSILTLVQDFELKNIWSYQPVKGNEWLKLGLHYKHIQAVDLVPLKRPILEEGVEYLAQELKEGQVVYVHCRAGCGRSVALVVAYLMEYQNLSLEEAYQLIKEQRPQVNLNKDQKAAVLTYTSSK